MNDVESIRVLLIEDDEEDYMITRDLLNSVAERRFDLTWASTLAKGLEIQESDDVDVVLLDLSLPDSFGWETLTRAQARCPDVPLVLLTGLADRRLGERAIREGAQDYLVKGEVDADRLARSIRYAVDRKAVEQQVRLSEKKYRTLYESSKDGILHTDLEGNILDANRSFMEMLDYDAEDLQRLRQEDLTPEKWRAADAEILQRQVLAKGYSDEYEKYLIKKSGTTVPVSVRMWLSHGPQGDPDGIWAIVRDIAERKTADDALRLYRDHLEDLVRRRTSQLTEANQKLQAEAEEREQAQEKLQEAVQRLEALDRARSEFVSNVSHELKTPLSSMMYALENIGKGVVGGVPEKVTEYLSMIDEDCQRLSRTIGDILDLSRIESHTLKLNRVKLLFHPFVERTVKSLVLQAQGKGHTLTVAVDGNAGFVELDPEKLERCIFNLVQNAIKYTPAAGTIEVVVRSSPEPPGFTIMDVIDTGIGIPAEHLEKVTERYFRVGEHISGTGLGLSLSKEIIELHGGKISLQSPPLGRESGTQVSAFLPQAEPATVLAVDDNDTTRDLIEKELAGLGYLVEPCKSGAEAFEKLEESIPDVIIMDLYMPQMDGVEAIARIKSQHEWRRLPILVITGGEIDRPKREVLQGFGIPALGKPWKREQLLHAIEDVVLGRQYAVR